MCCFFFFCPSASFKALRVESIGRAKYGYSSITYCFLLNINILMPNVFLWKHAGTPLTYQCHYIRTVCSIHLCKHNSLRLKRIWWAIVVECVCLSVCLSTLNIQSTAQSGLQKGEWRFNSPWSTWARMHRFRVFAGLLCRAIILSRLVSPMASSYNTWPHCTYSW